MDDIKKRNKILKIKKIYDMQINMREKKNYNNKKFPKKNKNKMYNLNKKKQSLLNLHACLNKWIIGMSKITKMRL